MTTPRSSEHAIPGVLACRRGLVFVSLFSSFVCALCRNAQNLKWVAVQNDLLFEQ